MIFLRKTGFFLALMLFCLSYFVFGFYYERGEGVLANLFAGVYGEPFNDLSYIAMVGYSFGLEFLYSKMPLIPWYDCLCYFFLWFSTGIYINVFLYEGRRNDLSNLSSVIFIIVLFITLLLPNLFLLNISRTSIYVASCGLVVIHINSASSELHRFDKIYILGVVLFVFGSLFRLEGGLGALAICGIYILIFSKSLKQSVFALILPSVVLFSIVGYFFLVDGSNETFINQLEPDVEYQIIGKRNVVGLDQMTSAEDSAKYMMATNWIINDPEQVSVRFLRSLIVKNNSQFNIQSTLANLSEQIQKHLVLNLLFIFTLLFALGNIGFGEYRKITFRLLGFYLILIVYVLIIAFNLYLDDRHWVPIFSIGTLLAWYEILKSRIVIENPKTGLMVSGILLIVAFVQVKSIFNISKNLKKETKVAEKSIHFMNTLDNVKYILLSHDYFHYTYTQPFKRNRIDRNIVLLAFNLGELAITEQYKTYLNKVCNCNSSDYKYFYKFLFENRRELAILTSEESLEMTTYYLENVHDVALFLDRQSSIEGLPEYFGDYRMIRMERD